MEYLDRGLVAMRASPDTAFVSWRMLGTDPDTITFNVYRSEDGSAPAKINGEPLANATSFLDRTVDFSGPVTYYVRPIIDGVGQLPSDPVTLPAEAPEQQYLEVPLQRPADVAESGAIPAYTYSANDTSVGDLDGDGQYEIVVKWDPSNAKDNSQSGFTGNVYLDAYKMDGTHLWRIDLGHNIRAGAHYTQFLVYDFDGDGKAEIVCKTADGTVSGTGEVIGDASADYRNGSGYVLSGPEFLTVFDGATGGILTTTDYVPERGNVSDWGDGYGNRVDRFLAAVAYLDGERPSIVMARGYYTRSALVAYDWRDGELTQRWIFDTGHATTGPLAAYRGQGAHSLSVGDVDGDGFDEIVYGAATIDHDGTGLYSTGLGHGDATHLSDMDPDRPGLEFFMIHESPAAYGENGSSVQDAATGDIIYGVDGGGSDVGRGVAADIDPRYVGYETWASRGGLYNIDGTLISDTRPGMMNFLVYWDGDLLRELLDGTRIAKWDAERSTTDTLFEPPGVASNNGTKSNPALSADLFGDWREEVIWRTTDSSALRIYSTTIPTEHRFRTLMHDRHYRLAIAWQNVAYNQPPHPGFYLGEDMSPPPAPDLDIVVPAGVSAPAPVADRFAQWLADQGLATDLSPDQDPDQDGLTLGEEYALYIEGQAAAVVVQEGEAHLSLPLMRSEFDYWLDTSVDLSTWTTVTDVMGLDEGAMVSLPSADDRAFYRLRMRDYDDYNTWPTVAISAPTPGEEIDINDGVTFVADANDADGSIAAVEFFVDDTSLGSVTAAPFEFSWTPPSVGEFSVRVEAEDDEGAMAYSESVTFSIIEEVSGGPTVYQAEDGLYGPHGYALEATNEGFNGTGYINFASADDVESFLEFQNVDGGAGGNALLVFRYALGTDISRTGALRVNGEADPITFDPSGGWSVWVEKRVFVELVAGPNNTVRLEANGEDLANVDELVVTAP